MQRLLFTRKEGTRLHRCLTSWRICWLRASISSETWKIWRRCAWSVSINLSNLRELIIAEYASKMYWWWIIIAVSPWFTNYYEAWVNNCVGLHNYAYFLLYVSYMAVATTLALYMVYLTELPETLSNPIVRQSISSSNLYFRHTT
jgi:hypothetical protein